MAQAARGSAFSSESQFEKRNWEALVRKELLQRLRPVRSKGGAVGPNSGNFIAHDFLPQTSWGCPEGGWIVGEGGESKMSGSWLGGDRLAFTGLRSDGKKPNMLHTRYPRARSCLGYSADGLTQFGELNEYNQTVKYDKFGNVQRKVTKVGARDELSLGAKMWQSSYDDACAGGLAPRQNPGDVHMASKGDRVSQGKHSPRVVWRNPRGKKSTKREYKRSLSVLENTENERRTHPMSYTQSYVRKGTASLCLASASRPPSLIDAQIEHMAISLREQGRVPKVSACEAKTSVRPPSYMPLYKHQPNFGAVPVPGGV